MEMLLKAEEEISHGRREGTRFRPDASHGESKNDTVGGGYLFQRQ